MNKNILLIKLSEIYPIGKIKYAPGTVASLFTCLIFFLLNAYFSLFILFFIFILFFCLSFIAIKIYLEKYGNKDHKSIVIDEFIGQFLALTIIPILELENNFLNISIIFILFRVFDISKIGLKSIEKLPGVYGILFDDIVAGIYSIIITYLIFL
tara:strand:+ start:226 stop:687 length:462 start_codon:yes stop_codon:yes gene_type:complete